MLTAIIVAAGSSRRMGIDKLFAKIAGKPVLAHAIGAFECADCVTEIILVARKDRFGEIEKTAHDQKWTKVRSIVPGGEHRQDSVRAGLEQLGENVRYVAVHDAARPLITPEHFNRVQGFVDRALKSGVKPLWGGHRDKAGELYFEPTLFDGVSQEMEIVQREVCAQQ